MLGAITRFIVYSNLFIAFCALAMKWLTDLFLNRPLSIDALTIFLFCATLISYNLHRLVAINGKKQKDNEVIRWSKRHAIIIYGLLVFGLLGCGITFWALSHSIKLVLLFLGVITVFYSIPLFFLKQSFKLREIPGIKILLIGAVWSVATGILPILQYDLNPFLLKNWIWILEQFLFIVVITLPFDIRDYEFDKAEGIKTIPIVLGVKWTERLGVALCFVLSLIHFENWYLGATPNAIYPLLAFNLFLYLLIRRAQIAKSHLFFLLLIDGTMILKFLLLKLTIFAF